MTAEEMERRIADLESKMCVHENAINTGYNELRRRVVDQNERIGRIENIVDAAITTAVHELIDYLRHDDIQSLDEQEFAESVKRLIFDVDMVLPF